MQVKARLDPLTSLRFFAAAMIVIGHAVPIFGAFDVHFSVQMNQGVSFFFVLSGFILTWNYPQLSNWTERRRFWLARFARVWPLHFVTCMLWVVAIQHLGKSGGFSDPLEVVKLLTNLLLLQAWVPLQSWALSFNGVAWSISVEMFFYAMFPLLIYAWPRRWHKVILLQIAAVLFFIGIGAAFQLPNVSEKGGIALPSLLYFNPMVRILEFTAGIATAMLVKKLFDQDFALSNSQWLVIELIACCTVGVSLLASANFAGIKQALGDAGTYYFASGGLWLVWALLIAVFALSRGPLTRVLSMRWMVFLGEVSFSLYLCHALLIHYLANYKALIPANSYLLYAAFWVWVLTLSSILFIGVETPCRKFILSLAAGNVGKTALKDSFRMKELIAVTLLVCMFGAMASFRPSTVAVIDSSSADAFVQSRSENLRLPTSAVFDERYQILALRIKPLDAVTMQVQVLLKAKQALQSDDVMFALHVNDGNGTMLTNYDMKLDFGNSGLPAGAHWVQKFNIPKGKLAEGKSLGLAMYITPTALFDAVGGNLDWGGKRLIVPLAQ